MFSNVLPYVSVLSSRQQDLQYRDPLFSTVYYPSMPSTVLEHTTDLTIYSTMESSQNKGNASIYLISFFYCTDEETDLMTC